MRRGSRFGIAVALAATLGALTAGCVASQGGGAAGSAAQKVYVKPGEHDAYYAFLSGGHSGNVYVYGIPSCRHITTIPVFTPEPAVGYGNDEESKAMLGGFTWGDAHHPGLSETDGDYDGRWLFINDMPNARIARIDLKDFAKEFKGIIAGIKVDPKSGTMSMGFEIQMPPFDYDLSDAGKGPSMGWQFFTCYNS